jgi:hypothetical protein
MRKTRKPEVGARDIRDTEVPRHLIDPQTGLLSASPPGREWLIARLTERRHDELRIALAGCEGLFNVLFRHLDFSGASFARQDLRGMNFEGCDFTGCGFDGALIDEASFRGARVSREQLSKAQDWPVATLGSLDRARRPGSCRPEPMKAPLHGARASWSEAHFAPEMTIVPPLADYCGLRADEKRALEEGRLSISLRPVRDIERARDAEMYSRRFANIGASDDRPDATNWREVGEYLATLNDWLVADYALPSPALLRAMSPLIEPEPEEFARDNRGPRRWVVGEGDFPFETHMSHVALPFHVVRLFAGTR